LGARKPKQLELELKTWGGKRPRAGRKRQGPRPLVPHRPRAPLRPGWGVHVTVRVLDHVWNLRARRSFAVISACFERGKDRFGCRLIAFSVQGNHLHLLMEATDTVALRRAISGLMIRIAKGLNRLMGRHGKVFADHYHSRVLRTPTEAARARSYVLGNFAHHATQNGRCIDDTNPDPLSSAAAGSPLVVAPRSWLMSVGWKRGRV